MKFEPNEQYRRSEPSIKLVRDCIEGGPKVKQEGTIYLKHPNAFDHTSASQVARYGRYLDDAEFDGFPAETERSMLGQMMEGEITHEFPESIEYLWNNSDGDGMPLSGAIEVTYKNILECSFYILLAELNGLAEVDTSEVSIADAQRLNARATIKHYTRESLIDWDFRRIDGVMQLSLMILVERSCKRDMSDFSTEEVASYLVLALDDDGNYYQQKYIEQGDTAQSEGERVYPEINGERLKWIPVEIICDEETPAGKIPERPGYLYAICSSALDRYRVSADYKEALRVMQPTTFTSGWKDGDWDRFRELNDREYIAFGSGVANNLPEGVTVDIKGMGIESQPYENYFEANTRKSIALGAKFDDGQSAIQQTATQSRIDNSRNTAVMRSISKNTEQSVRRVISYCAMYMGLWGQDEVETNLDSIALVLPKDFGTPRMTIEEVATSVNAGLISKQEGTRILVAAGKTISEAEQILDEIENQGPAIGALPFLSAQNQPNVDNEDE